MKKGLDWIIGILDKSGSMCSVRDDAIGGINTFIKEQQNMDDRTARMTLVLFDHEYQLVHDGVGIEDVTPFTEDTYVPCGTTALFDAIGRTVTDVGKKLDSMLEDERPENVIVGILTDGYENASKDYTKEQIKEMIDRQQNDYNWKFIFLAATQEGFDNAESIGIPKDRLILFDTNKVGESFIGMSSAIGSFRG